MIEVEQEDVTEEAEEVFDASPPDAIERLARIEGQSNFLSILAGVDVSTDTTLDMGALAFARYKDGIRPEVLETYVSQTTRHTHKLRAFLYDTLSAVAKIKPRDRIMVRAACIDAVELFRSGWCPNGKDRAYRLDRDKDAFYAVRKLAESTLYTLLPEYIEAWEKARFGQNRTGISRKCYSGSVR